MFTRVTGTRRWRAAITLLLAYGLCVIGPSVALALIDTVAPIHCGTKTSHHSAAPTHAHGGDVGHQDAGHDDDHHQPGDGAKLVTCCGVFCVTALSAAAAPDLIPTAGSQPTGVAVDRGIAGRGSPRIDRPPITFLPM